MSNEMNLPWKYREFHRGYGVVFDSAGSVILYPTPELAAHIAKCVNSHDALVAALEEILDYRGGAANALDDEYVVERARAALAKAQGDGE